MCLSFCSQNPYKYLHGFIARNELNAHDHKLNRKTKCGSNYTHTKLQQQKTAIKLPVSSTTIKQNRIKRKKQQKITCIANKRVKKI